MRLARPTSVPVSQIEEIRGLVVSASRKLCERNSLFTRSDCDDLVQDILLDISRKARRFDATRSNFKTFCTAILRSKIADVIRKRSAQKRREAFAAISLATKWRSPNGGFREMHQQLPKSDLHRHRASFQPNAQTLAELRCDLAWLRQRASSKDRELMQALSIGNSEAAVARAIGRTRRSIRADVLRLRGYFQSHNMEAYL